MKGSNKFCYPGATHPCARQLLSLKLAVMSDLLSLLGNYESDEDIEHTEPLKEISKTHLDKEASEEVADIDPKTVTEQHNLIEIEEFPFSDVDDRVGRVDKVGSYYISL